MVQLIIQFSKIFRRSHIFNSGRKDFFSGISTRTAIMIGTSVTHDTGTKFQQLIYFCSVALFFCLSRTPIVFGILYIWLCLL